MVLIHQPQYSIYIPSKGRAGNCLTVEVLEDEKIPFKIVVEPQDKESYIKKYGIDNCLIMDKNNQGLFYVRNWIKKYSKKRRELFHWQIDDNIKNFRVRENNKNKKVLSGPCLSKAEQFINRYKNIGIAGLSHTAFAFSRKTDIGVNKQVYSCVIVRNDIDIQWRHNIVDDTDYSMQILTVDNNKWCTILFHRLLIEKARTISMKGGNTEFNLGRGREVNAKGLITQWPGAFKVKRVEDKYMPKGRIKIMPSRVWNTFKQRPVRVRRAEGKNS